MKPATHIIFGHDDLKQLDFPIIDEIVSRLRESFASTAGVTKDSVDFAVVNVGPEGRGIALLDFDSVLPEGEDIRATCRKIVEDTISFRCS